MAKRENGPGEINKFINAVRIGVDGEGEIVGFAQWQTVLVGKGGIGIYAKEEEKRVEEEEKENTVKKGSTVVNRKL
jgi:hypothetical protein